MVLICKTCRRANNKKALLLMEGDVSANLAPGQQKGAPFYAGVGNKGQC